MWMYYNFSGHLWIENILSFRIEKLLFVILSRDIK